MKKKEKIIFGGLFIVLLIVCAFMYLYKPKNKENIGQAIVGGHVVLEFDINEDATYNFKGEYGDVNIEVLEGRFRVFEVDCPNHDCEGMGWIDKDSIMPILCIPNNAIVKVKGDYK